MGKKNFSHPVQNRPNFFTRKYRLVNQYSTTLLNQINYSSILLTSLECSFSHILKTFLTKNPPFWHMLKTFHTKTPDYSESSRKFYSTTCCWLLLINGCHFGVVFSSFLASMTFIDIN